MLVFAKIGIKMKGYFKKFDLEGWDWEKINLLWNHTHFE